MNKTYTTIELTVRNHPGVMSHVTGLFARRAFNLEGILCGSIGAGQSRMYLLVERDGSLTQVVRQLEKLYDVRQVLVRDEYDHTVFGRLQELLRARPAQAGAREEGGYAADDYIGADEEPDTDEP